MAEPTKTKTHNLYLAFLTCRRYVTFALENLKGKKEEAWGYVTIYREQLHGYNDPSIVVKDETGREQLPGKYLYLCSTGPHEDKELAHRMREVIENHVKAQGPAQRDRAIDGVFFGPPKWFDECHIALVPEYWNLMARKEIISKVECEENLEWLLQWRQEQLNKRLPDAKKDRIPPFEKKVPWEKYP